MPYLLFNNKTDNLSYDYDIFIDLFKDETTAEYVAQELNKNQKYPTFFVKYSDTFNSIDNLKIQELITEIKNRDL